MMNIAIIGHGFVGKAVDFGFEHPNVHKVIVDPVLYGNTTKGLRGQDISYAFVCVPTPMGEDGNINASIVREVVVDLIRYTDAIIIIKSTVTPNIISKTWDNSRIVYNPEFLVEKSALEDFINPDFHIIGSDLDTHVGKSVENLYENYSNCNPAPFFHMNLAEASFVKYGINTFLATKVTFFNQLFDVMKDFGDVNYSRVSKAIGSDPRIGLGHTKVPGFDKKKGYGGACFPKDVRAFVKLFQNNGSNSLTLLEKTDIINNDYRKQYEKDEREKAQHVNYE